MLIANNIKVRNHRKNLTQTILDNVSITLTPGRITCFLGQSGAGKTTLLNSLAQLQEYEGNVNINGHELRLLSAKEKSELVGIVFQQFNLFPHMNVLENCVHPLIYVEGMTRQSAKQKALNILQILDMGEYAQRLPSKLSGGQQQRVAIARALCLSPKVLLLDEPTSSLDPRNTYNIVEILKKLAARGLAIGVSSHDVTFIEKILDRVYLLENGKIREFYDSEIHSLNQDCPNIFNFLQTR